MFVTSPIRKPRFLAARRTQNFKPFSTIRAECFPDSQAGWASVFLDVRDDDVGFRIELPFMFVGYRHHIIRAICATNARPVSLIIRRRRSIGLNGFSNSP